MTVIRPNSISGITSITAQQNSIEFYKSDGSLSGANIDGISINTTGIITANTFYGNGANLTGITAGTSLSGSTNNTVCTVTGSNAIQGEANLTFDGNTLSVTGSGNDPLITNSTNANGNMVQIQLSGTTKMFLGSAGSFVTGNSGTSNQAIRVEDSLIIATGGHSEKFRIASDGHVAITTTGALKVPVGNNSQRPSSSVTGDIRYNTTSQTLEFYTGSAWVGTTSVPSINSITGDIYNGMSRTLVINCNDISASGNDVRYSNNSNGSVIATDTSATTSGSNITSTIPSAVYNNAVGTVIKIEVLNGSGVLSSNSLTKTIIASPSGGSITSAGGYRYHTFTSGGTFTNTIANLSVQYLVVAGGGGGGGNQGGGAGGAGGYRTGSATLGTGTYAAAIGGGGSNGGNGNGGSGNDGGNSSFNGLTSTGGGGGVNMRTGGYQGQNGRSGGSGGGASHWMTGNFTGGSGTSGQGNNGGNALDTESLGHNGGGGGGAGAAGSAGQGGYGGNGGNGSTWLNGTTYAGGGGGGCYYNNNSGGTPYSIGGGAGTGGGGRGSRNVGSQLSTNFTSPTTNQHGVDGYGGGGGGGGNQPGDGGDGVVIVRYAG